MGMREPLVTMNPLKSYHEGSNAQKTDSVYVLSTENLC